jgi:hypothetical protein
MRDEHRRQSTSAQYVRNQDGFIKTHIKAAESPSPSTTINSTDGFMQQKTIDEAQDQSSMKRWIFGAVRKGCQDS